MKVNGRKLLFGLLLALPAAVPCARAGSFSGATQTVLPGVVNSGGQNGLSSAGNNLTGVLDEPGQASYTSANFSLQPGFANLAAWPETVLNVAASTGAAGGGLILRWTAPRADGSTGTAAAYEVRYSTLPAKNPALSEANFLLAASVTDFLAVPAPGLFGTTEQLTLTGLEGGTTYYFAVKARSAWNGWSYLSNGAASGARVYPPVFGGFSGVGDVSLQFNWTSGGNGPNALYRVLASTAPDPLNPGGAVVTSSDTYNLFLSSAGLKPNTAYYFRVAGLNNNAAATAYTAAQGVSTLLAFPPIFTNFTNVAPGSINFNWSANGNAAGTRYRVLSSTAQDPLNPAGEVVFSSDTYKLSLSSSGLIGNTTYYFAVAGLNNDGVATDYTAVQATSTLASAPVFTGFSNVGDDTFKALWSAAGNAYPATVYRVLVSTAQDPLAPAGAPVIGNDTSEAYQWLTGLASQTTYYLRLSAINNNNVETAYTAANSTVTLNAIATKLYLLDSVAVINADSRSLGRDHGNTLVTYTKNTVAGPVTPPTAATQLTEAAAGPVITWYTNPLDDVTIAGNVTFNVWARESATAANATVTAELLRADGSGAILSNIGSALLNRTELTTTLAKQTWVAVPAFTSLVNGDRLALRLHIDDGNGVNMAAGRNVTVTVASGTAGVSGDSWFTVTEALAPARPAIGPITNVAARQLTAGWQLVEGATGYTLAASLSPENPPSSLYASSTTLGNLGATLDTPSLAPDTNYYLFVRTNGPGASSTWAAYPGTSTLLAYPPAFANFSAVTPSSLRFNWSDNGNGAGIRYRVAVSTAPDPLAPAGAEVTNAETYELYLEPAGLAANTTYYFRVAGLNNNGVETAYTAAQGTSTLVAFDPVFTNFSGVGAGALQFNWSANGNAAGTLYQVLSSTAPDPRNPSGALVVASNTYNVQFSSSGLAANTTYYFRVAGVNNNGVATSYTAARGTSTLANAPVFSGFPNVGANAADFGWLPNGNAAGTLYRALVSTAADPASPAGAAATASDTYNLQINSSGLAANTTYYFKVAAVNNNGVLSGYTAAQATSTLLAYNPVFTNFTSVAAAALQFNWSSGGNPAGTLYQVLSSTAPDPRNPSGALVVASNTYNVQLSSSGLAANTTYYFRVAGINNNGVATGYSAAQGASTLLAAAPLFTNFTNVAAAALQFNWSANGNAAGTLYSVAVSTAADPLAPSGAVFTASATYSVALSSAGLNPNTTYYFRVAGVNNNGVPTAYTAAQATSTLAALPSAFDFPGISSTSVLMTWSASGNGPGTLYRVLASTAPDPVVPLGALVTTSNTYATSLSTAGLQAFTNYYFRAAAINNNGLITSYSAAASTKTLAIGVLPAPVAGALTPYASSITANWSLVAGATGYMLAASTGPGTSPFPIIKSSTTMIDAGASLTGLTANTSYFLFVRSLAGGNVTSAWSDYPGVYTLLAAPPLFSAFSGVGANSAVFTWSANGNGAGTLYRVLVSTVADPLNPGPAAVTSSDTYNVSLATSGLSANTTYYFRVAGVNRDGAVTGYTAAQATATWAAAPVFSNFTGVGAGSVQFNWSANGNPALRTLYRVYSSTAADPLNSAGAAVVSSDTYNVALATAGLAANTIYYFRVAALGNNGMTTAYTAAAGTATLVAAAPVFVNFTAVSAGSAQFNWSANGNAAGTLYRVVSSTAADPLSPAGAVVSSSDTYNVALASAGLAANTAYYFRVAGVNPNNVATAYTAAAGSATLANIPLSAVSTFSALSDTGFTASWNGNSNPAGTLYTVQVSTAQDFNPGASLQVTASTVPAAGSSYAFTGLDFSTVYYFQARARNLNGVYTAYAALGSTRTLGLQAPVTEPVTQVTANSIAAGWQLAAGATGYTLAASVNPGAAPSPVYASSVTLGDLGAVLDTPALALNTTYYLFVRANGRGESGAWAAYPATSTLSNSPVAAAPTFSAVTFNSFAAGWGANSNPLGTTKYTVEISTAPDFNAGVTDRISFTTAPAAGPGVTFEGVNTDIYYYFRVRANHNNGNFSGWLDLGVVKTLALPVIHSAGDGVLLYGQAGNTMPLFRNYYSATNTFGAPVNTVAGEAGTLFTIKTNPLSSKQEAVAGYVKDGTLHVLCTDGTNWSEEWTQAVGGTADTKRFDIAYETNTGDALVLYSQGSAGTNEMGYRTKSGASACGPGSWSAHADLDPVTTSGVVQWIKMDSDPRASSGTIAAIWADSNSDLSAMVWNGAAWENEPAAALETSLEVVAAAQDVDDFAVQFESLSGSIMVVWANSAGNNATNTNGVRYARATWTGGNPLHTWGAATTPPSFVDDATNLALAANPNSNEMVFASVGNSGSDLQIGYWSGTAWTDTPNVDTSAQLPVAGSKLVSAGWLTSGATTRWVVAYNDSLAVNVGWYNGNGAGAPAPIDSTALPNFASPQKRYEMQQDPVNKDRLIMTVADGANDLFAKRLVMTAVPAFTWTDANGNAALETSLSTPTIGGSSFMFWPAPPTTTYEQSGYRFFANTATTDVGAPLAAQDTLAVLGAPGAAFRLRPLLHVGQVNLPIGGQAFKLQFTGRGDGTCDAPSNGTPADYTDVTAATLIAFNDNAPADGAALTANANDPKHGANATVTQTYEELNNAVNSVAGIARNQDGEWDFALKDNGMVSGTSYCFRLVKGDGSPLNVYGVYPEVMIPAVIYVNEVYPSGAAAADDWVELFNNTSSTVPLVGWKLNYIENTIDLGGTANTVWTGQAADLINAYSTFTASGLSMNLVGGQSYHVKLLNNAGGLVDQAQWPALSAGQSFARVTDGNPAFFEVDPTPTRGYANYVATDALKINEAAYGPLDRQFVELYNASATSTRTLAGYALRNAAASANGLRFRFTRKLYPQGYAVIDFSARSDDGKTFAEVFGPQGLASAGDFLALENSTGSVVNAVTWESGNNYSRYNYRGEKVSAGNFAPANAAASIIRQPAEGADTGSDLADFAASAFTTLASRNNAAGTAAANTLTYPVNAAAPQFLARKFPLRLTLGAASAAGAGNNLVFQRTGGAADAGSPHLYRLQDIGFALGSLAAQATVQTGLTFNDQDGAPLVSSAVYRVTLNSDTGAASAPQIILGTVTYDASVHAVTGSTVAPPYMNNATRAAVLKLEIGNNSPAGFNSLEVSTVTFTLLDATLSSALTTAQARNLFNAVMLVKDSGAAGLPGVYEPAIDLSTVAYVPMAAISLDAAGLSTLTVPSAWLSSAVVPAASTAAFYVVFESTQNASAWTPNAFRVRFNSAGAVTVRDVPGGLPEDFAASAQTDTPLVTLIAPAQAPAGTTWPYPLPQGAVTQSPSAYFTSTFTSVASSAVYVSATDGYLRAVKKNGAWKWSFATSPLSPIRISPNVVVEYGNVYVYFADDNGDIYKVRDDETAGTMIWKQPLGVAVKSNIMCSDVDCTGTKFYFGAGDNTVRCLNKSDGSACSGWTYASAVTSPISGTIVIDDRATINTGWIGLDDGKVVALQTQTGVSPTSYQTGGAIKSSPLLDARVAAANNVLYFTSADGKLYARVSSNLSSVPSGWTDYPTPGGAAIYTSPTLTFTGPKFIFFGDDDGWLHKVDAVTGASAPGWPFKAGGRIRSSPVWVPNLYIAQGGNDYVYFGCDDGYIYAVNANTGALRPNWPVATGGPVRSDLVIDPDTQSLLVGSTDGKTYTIYLGL